MQICCGCLHQQLDPQENPAVSWLGVPFRELTVVEAATLFWEMITGLRFRGKAVAELRSAFWEKGQFCCYQKPAEPDRGHVPGWTTESLCCVTGQVLGISPRAVLTPFDTFMGVWHGFLELAAEAARKMSRGSFLGTRPRHSLLRCQRWDSTARASEHLHRAWALGEVPFALKI